MYFSSRKSWFHPPYSLWYSTVWSGLGWSPRKYEAIPRTVLSKHCEHMYNGLSECVCVWEREAERERERECCVGKRENEGGREREVRKWNLKKKKRADIERRGESERKHMYCIYTGPFPSFSRLGTRVVTLYQHQPWASRQNTHTHTHTLTHTTHMLYTHQKSKHHNDLYTVFTAHLCSLSVTSL